jgi:DNA-binding transcriptional regulator LsrR (DeoR family)
MPVIAASPKERDLLHRQIIVRTALRLAAQADVTFLGIGELSPRAPLHKDGFVTKDELTALRRAGAVVEILGWAFDAEGQLIEGLTNARVASAPLPSTKHSLVIAVAKGATKLPGIRIAVSRPLVNGLITDEWTAEKLSASL